MSDDDSSFSANENPAAVASRLPQGNYRFSASRAVIIGIDDYQNIRQLGTAVSDAKRLAATLEDDHGYEDVQLLTDASRNKLIAELSEKLPERASSNDRLLLYFAGHGIALDGEDGPEGYLIPADARPDDPSTYIAMADLHRWLESLPCRHLLVVLDCCFAGSFTWYGGRSVRPIGKKLYREHYDRFLCEPAWQIITSAAHDQEALDVLSGGVLGVRGEHSADGERHSPFADAFFAALQGEGDLIPKGGGDGVVTATELYLYLRQSVEVGAEQYAKHRQTPELWPFSRTRHGKGEFIFLVPGQDEPQLEPAPTLTAQNNPYRGLESYDEAQTDLFFGRRGLVEELATKVDKHPFTVVVGASGTGKSSVVKAGLVPYLKKRAVADPTEDGQAKEGHSPRYISLPPFRPGDAPLQSLADLVATSLLEAVDQSDRVEPAKYVVETVGRWLHSHPDLMLLLVVDQAEELVTLCRDDTVRADFLQVLADALEQYPGQLRVVFTLRTDFEPQFDDSPLSGFWKKGRLVTPPMSRTELREVIEEAAVARVLFFDPPELVDTLIDEVQQTPGALPLLSFTLEQLYLKYTERQNKALIDGIALERSMTLADYESLGGVIGSLRRRAEEVLSDLPDDEHRATMQRIMLRMVAVEGGELARRRVTLHELVYPTDAENVRVRAVLARLEGARLLITSRQDGDGDGIEDAIVEPAHDALITAWDRLLLWKRGTEDHLPLQRRLWQAASEWEDAPSKRRNNLLWDDDPRLPQIRELAWPSQKLPGGSQEQSLWLRRLRRQNHNLSADAEWLNKTELEFVRESVRLSAHKFQRAITITAFVILVLVGFTIAAIVQAIEANYQRDIANAEQERADEKAAEALSAQATAVAEAEIARLAQANAEAQTRIAQAGELAVHAQTALATNVDPSGSLPLILASKAVMNTWEIDHIVTVGADAALRDAIDTAPPYVMTLPRHRHNGPASSAAYSPDDRIILTGSEGHTDRIESATTGDGFHQLDGHTSAVTSAAYSPDGRFIATASEDGTARIWDAATGQELRQLRGHIGPVTSVTYSPNGKFVATASNDRTVIIWDSITGAQVRQLRGAHTDIVSSAKYSPDGNYIITASWDQTARVWDVSTGQSLLILSGHTGPTYSAAYSPDGSYIVTASGDQTARIWTAATGEELRLLSGHAGSINSAAYSPDGNFIVTASADTTALIWDAVTGKQIRQLSGAHTDNISSATFSPDGKFVVTASWDQTARIWEAATGTEIRLLSGHTNWVNSAAYSPDGFFVVTASGDFSGDDQTARIWNTVANEELRLLSGHGDPVNSAVYGPDGRVIVTASYDHTARIWDAATGKQLHILSGHIGPVYSAAYSPDGRFVVTASADQTARIWDAATGTEMGQLRGHAESVSSAAYDPDGNFIVTASDDQTVRIWDAATGEELRRLMGHTASVTSAVYSPDGKLVITASWDQTARVWDASSGEELRRLMGHIGPVTSAAYSPDGNFVVTASDDQTTRIWDALTGKELRQLKGHTAPVTSAVYSPDGNFIATSSEDWTVRIWNATTGHEFRQLVDRFDFVRSATYSWIINSVAYSPDGDFIITASGNWTARIWIASVDDLLTEAARLIQRDPPILTQEERRRYELE